jgi:hypothetical protein
MRATRYAGEGRAARGISNVNPATAVLYADNGQTDVPATTHAPRGCGVRPGACRVRQDAAGGADSAADAVRVVAHENGQHPSVPPSITDAQLVDDVPDERGNLGLHRLPCLVHEGLFAG